MSRLYVEHPAKQQSRLQNMQK